MTEGSQPINTNERMIGEWMKKAIAFDSIYQHHQNLVLQSEGHQYVLDIMDWLLENPTKAYRDYPYTINGQEKEDL